mgnify:FL=1
MTDAIEQTDDGPVLHLADGTAVKLLVMGDGDRLDFKEWPGEGVAAFENDTDGTISVSFLEHSDIRLPFRAEWEIGVNEAGDEDDWAHLHPLAKSESEAREQAIENARGEFTDPQIYMVDGPFPPESPTSVGKDVLEEVFGG